MKTKQLFLMLIALFILNSATQLQSQNLFETNNSFQKFDFKSLESQTISLRNYEVNIDDYKLEYTVENAPKSITENDAQEMVFNHPLSFIAFGAGLGIISDQTLWCLHAEYYLRLAMLKHGTIFGALGASYSASNSDFITATLFDITLKGLMFTQLAKEFKQVAFIYGFALAYGFGSEEFEGGYKYDLTRFTLGLVIGFQIMLTAQWAIMIQTHLFNYQELTRKHEDLEITDYSRWALINKSNILAFSLVYHFANSKR